MKGKSQNDGLGWREAPDVVYHYTSTDTLLKIVESQSIWATNIRYLNDISEHDYCIRLLRRRVSKFLKVNPAEGDDGQHLRVSLSRIKIGDSDGPYVASFSRLPDSLPQWRSYCPNGNGVSIGFEVGSLRDCKIRAAAPSDRTFARIIVDRVRYLSDNDFDAQDEILRVLLIALREWRSNRKKKRDPYERTEDESMLMMLARAWATVVKHPGFESEQEYRLIVSSVPAFQDGLKFRASKTTVIPFLELEMPRSCEDLMEDSSGSTGKRLMSDAQAYDYFIREIIVGPTPNPDLTVSALNSLFTRRIFGPEIKRSRIPFRDL